MNIFLGNFEELIKRLNKEEKEKRKAYEQQNKLKLKNASKMVKQRVKKHYRM